MTRTGILRTTNRFLTGTSAIGDAVPGASVAGYVGQPNQYQGQLGAIDEMSFSEAQSRSDSVTGVALQGCRLQYVQFAADGTAYAAGQVLYWKDETNYIVTNVPPASLAFAGIAISPVTQGNFWFIQTAGVAWILFGATVIATAGTPVYSDSSTPSVAVNTTDATIVNGGVTPISGTSAGLKRYLGTVKGVPTLSVVNLVYLVSNMSQVF